MPAENLRATTLIVEIDGGGEPVEGRIGPSPHELHPFRGWSELAAAIERYRPEPTDWNLEGGAWAEVHR